jgi:multiple sugar transport system permease protein
MIYFFHRFHDAIAGQRVPTGDPFFVKIGHYTQIRLMLLPYLLGILLLVFIPAGISFALAFFHYDGISPPGWAGNLNFILAFTDELFALSARNSLALIILPAPLRILAMFLAAYLSRGKGRLPTWLRAAVYLPSIVPPVAYALAWLWILNPLFGPVNLLLKAAGLYTPGWFADPNWSKPALVFMFFWQIGEGFLVCLAAIQDVPGELEEAAHLDGASAGQVFWKLYLPLLSPILLLLAFRDAILILQESFTAVLITTGGGPYYSTYTLPMFIYEQAFGLLSFGTAGAALWMMYLIAGGVVLYLFNTARQWNVDLTDETFVL